VVEGPIEPRTGIQDSRVGTFERRLRYKGTSRTASSPERVSRKVRVPRTVCTLSPTVETRTDLT
jgi:hypothetical protein